MNKVRRKRLVAVESELESIISEEQEAFDNMPENLQDSEKGEKMEEDISVLESSREEISSIAYE